MVLFGSSGVIGEVNLTKVVLRSRECPGFFLLQSNKSRTWLISVMNNTERQNMEIKQQRNAKEGVIQNRLLPRFEMRIFLSASNYLKK